MSKKNATSEVSIGKFAILATHTYAQALLHGLDDDEAKQRGMVAAIMALKLGLASARSPTSRSQKSLGSSNDLAKIT